ncbi:MAG: L-threonylcarbamoyladenylate synthase [Prevotella sp.]
MRIEDDIKKAVETMNKGGVILYPTDTVWGLGCDATNAEAVAKIYDIKKREDSKAMICLTDQSHRLQRYIRNAPEVAWDVLELSTKPTTVIFDNVIGLAPNLMAEDGSVGFRITSEPFSQQLCYRMQKPIVSTSANFSGEPTPQNYRDISEELISLVDYVCYSRRQEKKPHTPSKVVKIGQDGEVKIIR